MNSILAFAVLALIVAAGDMVATKTKGAIPSLFFASLLILLGFWFVIPQDIFEEAGLSSIAPVILYLTYVHLGSLLELRELSRQWVTILISLGAMAGATLFVLALGIPLLGYQTAIAGAGPITGGIISALIVNEKATSIGLPDLGLIATLIIITQGFVGYPLSAILLRREAKRVLQERFPAGKPVPLSPRANVETKKKYLIPQLPKGYETASVHLLRIACVALLAIYLSDLAGAWVRIHPAVFCLIFGMLAAELGWIKRAPLTEGNSFGLALFIIVAYLITSLHSLTPERLGEILVPVLGSIALGSAGLILGSLVIARILKVSPHMAVTVGLTALYGFPGTYLLAEETAKGASRTEEEYKLLMDWFLPKMLVAGFVTLDLISVIITSILMNYLS